MSAGRWQSSCADRPSCLLLAESQHRFRFIRGCIDIMILKKYQRTFDEAIQILQGEIYVKLQWLFLELPWSIHILKKCLIRKFNDSFITFKLPRTYRWPLFSTFCTVTFVIVMLSSQARPQLRPDQPAFQVNRASLAALRSWWFSSMKVKLFSVDWNCIILEGERLITKCAKIFRRVFMFLNISDISYTYRYLTVSLSRIPLAVQILKFSVVLYIC